MSITKAFIDGLTPEDLEQLAERLEPILRSRLDASSKSTGGGYLNVEGAAEFLACPRSRVYALVSSGRLPHQKDGSRLLFEPEALRAFVRSGGARRA